MMNRNPSPVILLSPSMPFAPPCKGDFHYTLYSRTGKEKTGKKLPFKPFSA
jgi:hypothetical protein